MQAYLADRTVGFVVTQHGIDDAELTGPRRAAEAAGAATVLIAPWLGAVETTCDGAPRASHEIDWLISDAESRDVDALVLPDGIDSTDAFRGVADLPRLISDFAGSRKPVGAFGHAVVALLDAGLLAGRHVTSSLSLQRELVTAGARWHDRRVVVDDNIITSRAAQDVEAFNTQLIAFLDQSQKRRCGRTPGERTSSGVRAVRQESRVCTSQPAAHHVRG